MKILDYLKKENIKIWDSQNLHKNDVLNELINIVLPVCPQLDKEDALKQLNEREKIGSTGVGRGVAIPHCRVQTCREALVALIILEHPVDYNSLDGKPVKLFFMIITPKEKVNLHLRFLARVSRILRDNQLRDDLFDCRDRDKVHKILQEYENKHF